LSGGYVGGAGAGEVEGNDDLVVQILGYALGQRRLLEREVVIDGVVGDGRGFVRLLRFRTLIVRPVRSRI
jgi:hypothetical protein